ncbi:hypothetical protein HA402_010630 [Bradysia odoriphaga]|nr:hypothetical protein HA402_010630 [Bradysia odoriphaga]
MLLLISSICFLMTFIQRIVDLILPRISFASAAERRLEKDLIDMKQQQSKLSPRDDYTAFVRLDRKINETQAYLLDRKTKLANKKLVLKYGLSYATYGVLTFVLIVISFLYRTTPVIVFDSRFDFTPFGFIMRFPTGISGAVSIPFWIFVNSFVSKNIASYF